MNEDIMSARIRALEILQTQMLAIYLMESNEPAKLIEEMKEGSEALLKVTRPEIQEKAREYLGVLYHNAHMTAQNSD